MRVASLLALAVLAALPATAQAREGDFLLNLWTDEAACSDKNAVSTTFAEVEADAAGEMDGGCVRLDGLWRLNVLYEDRAAVRRIGGDYATLKGDRSPPGRLGLYARPEFYEAAPETPREATVYGVVRTCEHLWKDAVFVAGYCHYVRGPILIVSRIDR